MLLTKCFKNDIITKKERFMIASVFTILFGSLALTMFSYPVFWAYTGSGMSVANQAYNSVNTYNILDFTSNNSPYMLASKICIILAMIFCCLMILLALVNLIGLAAGNAQPKVEVRLLSCAFFFFMLCAGVLLAIYLYKNSTEFVFTSIGYGFISSLVLAFLSLFSSPSRRKGLKKQKREKKQANEK